MVVRRSRLIRTRKAVGFTQESLAEAMNVDRATVRRWECGEAEPQPYRRPKLARLLGVSLADLEKLLSPTVSLQPNGTANVFVGSAMPGKPTVEREKLAQRIGLTAAR